jgi:hypothetical protein
LSKNKVINPMKIKILVLIWAAAALLFQTHMLLADEKNSENSFRLFASFSSDRPKPAPGFSPEEVVIIQLRAFQENDEKDRGIETVFGFAAPENKKYTGPLDFFKAMVKNPTYEPLLNLKKYDARKMHVEGNEAQQIVVVTDKNGKKAAYLFSLSKQADGPHKGCWMTNSVIRLAYEEKTVNA